MARIAFLGTGLMGAPMAVNLVKAGHEVTAWNRTPAKAQPVVDAGGRAAENASAAARGAEAVFVMLTDGPAVTEMLFEHGVADVLTRGTVVIDCSSIPPDTAREHARYLGDRGVSHLDAPVSGGPSGAEEGALAIMAGGEADAFDRARPFLEVLGRPTRVGPAGAGQMAKLANQVIVALAIGAVGEGLLLAQAGGADPAKVREAMTGGFADSKILQIHGQRMLERTFVPGGPAKVHLKDLRTILDAAKQNRLHLPLSETVAKLFEDLVAHGGGGYDHSAVLLELERLNQPARLGDRPDTLPDKT
jgi:2-hydroxy-3-oxopropionate reductase